MHAIVRDKLKELAQSGRIEIGLSYHVVFELLQKAEPRFRRDRLERARLLTELCGRNAFPYPTDLGQHGFSTEGLWVPRVDLEDVDIERAVGYLTQAMAVHPEVTRHERRVFSKQKYFTRWVAENPERFTLFAQKLWPFKFGTTLVESGDLSRYILGEITRSDANRKLWFYITDPVTVYEIWFEQYGGNSPIADRRDQISTKLVLMAQELQSMLGEAAKLQAEIKEAIAATGDDALSPVEHDRLRRLRAELRSFQEEISSPQDLYERSPNWKELFGDQAALVAAQILYAFHREKRSVRQSDGIDFVHAMYLPYTDLWRGDKAFSDLVIKHRVKFCERVVTKLEDLPERVEAEIAKRARTEHADLVGE
jgi:hypothetical protein